MKPTDEAVWYIIPKGAHKLHKRWRQMLCITEICKSVCFSVILVYFFGRAKITKQLVIKATWNKLSVISNSRLLNDPSMAPQVHLRLPCESQSAPARSGWTFHFMHVTCSLHKKLEIYKNVSWIRLQCKLNPARAVCIMMYIIRCTLLSAVRDACTEQNLLNMLWILQH